MTACGVISTAVLLCHANMHWKQGTHLQLHGGQAVHVGQLQQRLHFHGRVLRRSLSPQRRQRVGVHLQQGAATHAGVHLATAACRGWLQVSEGQLSIGLCR